MCKSAIASSSFLLLLWTNSLFAAEECLEMTLSFPSSINPELRYTTCDIRKVTDATDKIKKEKENDTYWFYVKPGEDVILTLNNVQNKVTPINYQAHTSTQLSCERTTTNLTPYKLGEVEGYEPQNNAPYPSKKRFCGDKTVYRIKTSCQIAQTRSGSDYYDWSCKPLP